MGNVVKRLADLRPVLRRIYRDFTPHTGGVGTDECELSFDCPKCGAPNRIIIKTGPQMDFARRVWQAQPNFQTSGMHVDEWVQIATIVPSIDMTVSGHGRKSPRCTFHGNITNGEVTCA